MKNIKFFYITASNKKESEQIAKKLLNKKLIACANVISNVNSYFVWKNKVQNSKEIIICGKTTSKNQKKNYSNYKKFTFIFCAMRNFF